MFVIAITRSMRSRTIALMVPIVPLPQSEPPPYRLRRLRHHRTRIGALATKGALRANSAQKVRYMAIFQAVLKEGPATLPANLPAHRAPTHYLLWFMPDLHRILVARILERNSFLRFSEKLLKNSKKLR